MTRSSPHVPLRGWRRGRRLFGKERNHLFQEVVRLNSQDRIAAARDHFASIPPLPPLETIEKMAEATVLACVDERCSASVMVRGLMELPDLAADIYRAEMGAIEALWTANITTHLPTLPSRNQVAVHVAPYAVHACMSFGLWLAALRHKPATAQGHARQYAEGIGHVARIALPAFLGRFGSTAAVPFRS